MRRLLLPAAMALVVIIIGGSFLYSAPIGNPFGGYANQANRLATLQQGWQYARNVNTTGYVSADDAPPDPNAMTWQNTGDYFVIPPEWNYLSLSFFCYGDGTGDGDANAGTFDCNVYVVDSYSSWDHVCSFTCAVGELELTHFPAGSISVLAGSQINSGSLDPNQSYKWAEGPFTAATDYKWVSSIDYTGCTNGIGRANFDAIGARVLVVLIDNRATTTRVYPVVKGR